MSVYAIYSSLRYYNQVTSKLDSAPVAEPKLLVKQDAGFNFPYLFSSILSRNLTFCNFDATYCKRYLHLRHLSMACLFNCSLLER